MEGPTMSRFAKARWRGPIPNDTRAAMIRPILGLVLHVEQGSETGTDGWFHNPGAHASAHFGNPLSGGLDQWVDTDDKAWAEIAGNPRWVSVEHEGYTNEAPAPTKSQLENDAQLLAWLHLTEGVPLQITDDPTKPGLGWHGMGGAAWGGHENCPGSRIKNARPLIIARAKQLIAPSGPRFYTVQRGDSVASVCRKFGLTRAQLDAMNPTMEAHRFVAGERLEVRTG
jgi:hypothetical protein